MSAIAIIYWRCWFNKVSDLLLFVVLMVTFEEQEVDNDLVWLVLDGLMSVLKSSANGAPFSIFLIRIESKMECFSSYYADYLLSGLN